ncbi:hypothetical protein CPAR01_11352 [Colletotrichum paranaense]|uniref:Uncharacterized protein n=1 Tax=Colletotrichum paranaense TaxID=1914294 RepID=A0ABQ9SC24_9PEZI|nr:uncharacterized protein CPAR01_11352 [Colletotrichum paranaense]KAK1531703.1 hypothetical protein CPAR01_11352 [Colletotrichum paranaense]
MKFSQSSRILGVVLAVSSICLAMPQEISQDNQPSASRVGEVPYEQSPYEETPYNETPHEDSGEGPSPYEQPDERPSYGKPSYGQPPREKPSYGHTPYGRDPAISIIEWEVGSPALYAARSVGDPDTCPKGTVSCNLPRNWNCCTRSMPCCGPGCCAQGFDCVDAAIGVCCSRGKKLCGGMCVSGECCGVQGGCSRDEKCWMGKCYPKERGPPLSSGAGGIVPPVTGGAGPVRVGKKSGEGAGRGRRDSMLGFVVLVGVWVVNEVWGGSLWG